MSNYYSVFPILPLRGYLKIGDKGNEIKVLQALLNWTNNGTICKPLEVDGVYGLHTEDAVRFFERIHNLKIDGEFGKKCLKTAKALEMSEAWQAINWAVSIALDNRFTYGVGKRAHHNGCYFCGTNITGPKKAKKGSRWEYTYCCNPFIHAAYAHGAKIQSMLKACKKANAAGMYPKDWKKHGFRTVGKCSEVKFSDLVPGDVIICQPSPNHVWMYTGGNWLVEASGESFSADSIAHKKGAHKKYREYKRKQNAYVMRFFSAR